MVILQRVNFDSHKTDAGLAEDRAVPSVAGESGDVCGRQEEGSKCESVDIRIGDSVDEPLEWIERPRTERATVFSSG